MSYSRRAIMKVLLATNGALAAASSAAHGQGSSEFTAITRGSDRLLNLLETQPYVSEGNGKPLFIIMSQSCPYCLALRMEQPRPPQGVEFRWLPGPYSGGNNDQMVEVRIRRDVPTFNAYMTRQLSAPPLTSRSGGIDIYNQSVVSLKEIVSIIAQNNGVRGTPAMIWLKNGTVYQSMGYTKEIFNRVVRHMKA